ncbi:hypothetical protein RJ55_02691 [Drechmeria coniospora]|nr:hypothetical protein RJ55_02691 [Drechmeria coniospora]
MRTNCTSTCAPYPSSDSNVEARGQTAGTLMKAAPTTTLMMAAPTTTLMMAEFTPQASSAVGMPSRPYMQLLTHV